LLSHRFSLMQESGVAGFRVLALTFLILLAIHSPAQRTTRPAAATTKPEQRALDPLTGQEQAVAERIARNDSKVKELLGESGVRVVSVLPVLIKTESPEKFDVKQRQIEVVLFRPQGEVGARVVVNLRQNNVVAVSRLTGDQVPYTNDDLADAFQLALRDPEVVKALGPEAQTFQIRSVQPGRAAPRNVVEGLPVRSSDPNDPCSKHRCLWLMFRRGNDYLSQPSVTVDLTDKRVYVEKPATDRKADH
jgi:hypothetical protein